MNCPANEELLRFLDDGVTGERANELQVHLRNCHSCDGVRRDFEATIAEVASVKEAFQHPPRRAAVLAALAEREPTHQPVRPRWLSWFWLGSGGLATAAVLSAVVGIVTTVHHPEDDAGFQARNGATPAQTQWVGLHVYAWDGTGAAPTEAHKTIRNGDYLLFAYTNLDNRPLSNLIVLAHDAQGKIHWLHPRRPSKDKPQGLTVRANASRVEIPEAVRVEFPVGVVQVAGIFSNDPIMPTKAEQWIRGNRPKGDSDDHAHAVMVVQSLQVLAKGNNGTPIE